MGKVGHDKAWSSLWDLVSDGLRTSFLVRLLSILGLSEVLLTCGARPFITLLLAQNLLHLILLFLQLLDELILCPDDLLITLLFNRNEFFFLLFLLFLDRRLYELLNVFRSHQSP